MLYREILKKSWHNTWSNKYLWFFGLFAALLGNGGEIDVIFRGFNTGSKQELFLGWHRIMETGIFSRGAFRGMGKLAANDPFSLFLALSIMILLIVLGVFLVWMTMVSQAAIVNNSSKIDVKKKTDFKEGVDSGIKNFLPVFGLNLFSRAAIYILFVLISLPILTSVSKANFMLNSVLFLIAFLIFIPLSIVVSFIVKYAIAFTVVKGAKFGESIKMGWNLFVENWLISIEMAFILFFINLLVGLFLIILFLVLAVPFMFVILLFTQMALYFNFWAITVAALILYLFIAAVVGSALATFQISTWTMLFMELTGKGLQSKLNRIFAK